MKRRALYLTLLLCVSLTGGAQTASQLLQKTSSALASAGCVRMDFTMSTDGGAPMRGEMTLSGRKFALDLPNHTVWFNGKTMWTLVKNADEVNVTTPTGREVEKMNPYALLERARKEYKAAKGAGTKTCHELTLTGTASTQYERIVLRMDRKSLMPASIRLIPHKGAEVVIECAQARTHQKCADTVFAFDKRKHPKAEIVDLR